MTTAPANYAFGTTVDLPLDEAIAAITAALKEEGFGILTQIDVAATLQQKLNVSFEPYVILGACNPSLAHQALTLVHDIGLLLPCNVVVHAQGARSRIDVADPITMLGLIPDPRLTPVATQARERLYRAVQTLGAVDSAGHAATSG
jgi:uncharacterized protein (DUF302 family)